MTTNISNHEATLLAELLTDSRIIPDVRRIISSAHSFTFKFHIYFYEVILILYDEFQNVDMAMFANYLKTRGLKEELLYAQELIPLAYNARMAVTHAKLVEQAAIQRKLGEIIRDLHTENFKSGDPSDAIEQLESEISDLKDRFNISPTLEIGRAQEKVSEQLARATTGRAWSDKRFHFTDIDRMTGGLEDGSLIVIGGKEKSGKSTLALQVVLANAKNDIPCLIFSQEMSDVQILLRMGTIESKLDLSLVWTGRITDVEFARLQKTIIEICTYPIFVNDGVSTILDIQAETKRFVQTKPNSLIVVDYIQLVRPVKRDNSREREVAEVSNHLKMIAKDSKIPVISLTQLNEDGRSRESRAVEQDMDKMITIDPKATEASSSVIPIRIRQRMGSSGRFGDVKLYWDEQVGRFENYSQQSE